MLNFPKIAKFSKNFQIFKGKKIFFSTPKILHFSIFWKCHFPVKKKVGSGGQNQLPQKEKFFSRKI
jgi:hypothetical protein